VLTEPSSIKVSPDEIISISAIALTDGLTVYFNDVAVAPQSIGSDYFTVKVPSNVTSGHIKVNSKIGDSNELAFFVKKTIEVGLEPTSGLDINDVQIETVGGIKATKSDTGDSLTIEISDNKLTSLLSWILDESGVKTGKTHLTGYVFPGDSDVDININSTAQH